MRSALVLGLVLVLVLGPALLLTGCPGESAPAPAAVVAFDPSDERQVFLVYAAHKSGDPDLIQRICQRFGLYDEKGTLVPEKYATYTSALARVSTGSPEKWSKFVRDNDGKWADYVKANG